VVEEIPDQVGNDEEEKVGNDEEEKVGNDEEKVEPVPEPVEGPMPVKKSRKWLKVLLIVLAVVVGLLILFAILGRVAPGLLDPLLYSKEELEILRY
jgi:cytoskeletal protein RodZ